MIFKKSLLKALFLGLIFLAIPSKVSAGFPEGESGYDLKKLKILLDYLVMKLETMIVLLEH